MKKLHESEVERIAQLIESVTAVDEQVTEILPAYGVYHRESRKKIEYFCTRCNRWCSTESKIKHKTKGLCSDCHSEITFLSEGLSRGGIAPEANFVRFKAINKDELVAAFYTVRERFENPNSNYFVPAYDGTVEYEVSLLGGYYYTHKQAVKLLQKPMRYGFGDRWEMEWVQSNPSREPNFVFGIFRYGDNEYHLLDSEEARKTFLRYAWEEIENLGTTLTMTALTLYAEHPNAEYLSKAGYERVVMDKINGCMFGLRINWRSNNLKKMLGLNSEEIVKLSGATSKKIYEYKLLRTLQKYDCDTLVNLLSFSRFDDIATVVNITGLSYRDINNYIMGNNRMSDWVDYLRECRMLDYNMKDTAIVKPHNLLAAHERTSQLISAKNNMAFDEMIKHDINKNKKKLCFDYEDLTIVLPECINDIAREGKLMMHCVGGYAERHARGALFIVFLRHSEDIGTPYYTIEISKDGDIIQCRGFRNNNADNPKTEQILAFEKAYQEHLDKSFKKRKRKSA